MTAPLRVLFAQAPQQSWSWYDVSLEGAHLRYELRDSFSGMLMELQGEGAKGSIQEGVLGLDDVSSICEVSLIHRFGT